MSTGSHARIPQHMISLYSENLVHYHGFSFHSKQTTCKYNTVKKKKKSTRNIQWRNRSTNMMFFILMEVCRRRRTTVSCQYDLLLVIQELFFSSKCLDFFWTRSFSLTCSLLSAVVYNQVLHYHFLKIKQEAFINQLMAVFSTTLWSTLSYQIASSSWFFWQVKQMSRARRKMQASACRFPSSSLQDSYQITLT